MRREACNTEVNPCPTAISQLLEGEMRIQQRPAHVIPSSWYVTSYNLSLFANESKAKRHKFICFPRTFLRFPRILYDFLGSSRRSRSSKPPPRPPGGELSCHPFSLPFAPLFRPSRHKRFTKLGRSSRWQPGVLPAIFVALTLLRSLF